MYQYIFLAIDEINTHEIDKLQFTSRNDSMSVVLANMILKFYKHPDPSSEDREEIELGITVSNDVYNFAGKGYSFMLIHIIP